MIIKIKVWFYIWLLKTLNGYFNISVKCIFAQASHETGNFKSAIFKENNNLFGMRQAKVRKTTATGENKYHATYKNIYSSVVDYFLRQKNFRIPNTNDTAFMVGTVSSNYATDRLYLTKWQNTIRTIKKPLISKLLMYGGLFFLLLTLYILIKKVTK